MDASSTIVIAGFSLAGLRAAEALRRAGFEGRIVALNGEAHAPYDRPPLSKEVLAGSWEPGQTTLAAQGLDHLSLELRNETRAGALDAGARVLTTDAGERIGYDGLVIATGATPRRLPAQPDLDNVFTLRTLDDAKGLRRALDGARRVCVIGAGFIGAEVAATCRGRDLEVTVLEALAQPMVRGLGATIGAACAQLHRDHGVDLRLGVTVEAIEGDGRVERVRLADGTTVECDVLVVGIGVVPNTDWLEGSGLRIDNGVVCDQTMVAAPGAVACGDVARFDNALFDGLSMRLEHWTNASEQADYAARRLLAGTEAPFEPFAPVPFVWSDQYGIKIQSAGSFSADDDVFVAHGTLEDYKFVALFGRAGRLVGALAFRQPRLLMQYRRLISQRASWDEALAAAAS